MVEDLEQEGVVGLLEAIDRWDPEGGAALPTYAITGIWGKMKNFLRYEARNRAPSHPELTEWLIDPAVGPEVIAVSRVTSDWMSEQLTRMTPRERQVTECRFFWGWTNTETRLYLGISHTRVTQLEAQIKKRLGPYL